VFGLVVSGVADGTKRDAVAILAGAGGNGTIADHDAEKRAGRSERGPCERGGAVNHRTALVALHAAVLLFGFAALFGKWLDTSPVAIVLGRTTVAAAALGLMRMRAGHVRPPFELRLVTNGAVLALHWVSFFAAIQVSSVAIGLLGYGSFPVFVLVLERLLLRRRWTARKITTALLVAAGLVLVVPEYSFADHTVQGLAWGLVSGFSFALLAVLNRRLVANRRALDVAFWQNLTAAACLLPFAWAAPWALGTIGGREILLLLVLGLGCTALAHTLFIASLRVVSAHRASVVAALEPVYGIVLAVLLLGEIPSVRVIAGGALIVGAAVVASRYPMR
jgi:drug/metabolite transporter (DMT)-like permease